MPFAIIGCESERTCVCAMCCSCYVFFMIVGDVDLLADGCTGSKSICWCRFDMLVVANVIL